MRKLNFILLSLLLPFSINAQSDELGNWLMYFGQNRVSDKISLHSEVQYRNHTVAPVNIEQLLLRTGVNYHLAKNAFATGGYGYISSYNFINEESVLASEEHRIWQQFILTNLIGRVKFEHRYRIEQRWVNDSYKNRWRYRLMLFIPLNKEKIEPGAVTFNIYDEVFLNTKATFFDRNRWYVAMGYQVNKSTGIQVGMLHQQVNTFGKWYLQFALIFNPDFRNTEQ